MDRTRKLPDKDLQKAFARLEKMALSSGNLDRCFVINAFFEEGGNNYYFAEIADCRTIDKIRFVARMITESAKDFGISIQEMIAMIVPIALETSEDGLRTLTEEELNDFINRQTS